MNSTDRLVAKLHAQPLRAKVRHYRGMPPELTSGNDLREQMPAPAVLLIETTPDGIFLIRLGADGQDVGDTWHQSIIEAQEQATFEFGNALSNWVAVPSDEKDPFAFGLRSNFS